jgi:hypothetical protein
MFFDAPMQWTVIYTVAEEQLFVSTLVDIDQLDPVLLAVVRIGWQNYWGC